MYILTNEPAGGLSKEAFDALDSAFGTSEFSQGQAVTAIANALEPGTGKAESVLRDLISGGFVTEVE